MEVQEEVRDYGARYDANGSGEVLVNVVGILDDEGNNQPSESFEKNDDYSQT